MNRISFIILFTGVILAAIFLVPHTAKAGLRRMSQDEVCLNRVQSIVGVRELINYDYKEKKAFVATKSEAGKFVVYSPSGENFVDGRSCISDDKLNSSTYLAKRIDSEVKDTFARRPHYGFLGELRGNPQEFQDQVRLIEEMIRSCNDIEDTVIREAVGNISKQYFSTNSESPKGDSGKQKIGK